MANLHRPYPLAVIALLTSALIGCESNEEPTPRVGGFLTDASAPEPADDPDAGASDLDAEPAPDAQADDPDASDAPDARRPVLPRSDAEPDAPDAEPPAPDAEPEPECSEGDWRVCPQEICAVGIQRCADGLWGPCEGSPESCNGVDDDCDGEVDEDYPDLGEPCEAELGMCLGEGVVTCDHTERATTCLWIGTPPQGEACDGEDNDCDGKVDEDIAMACYTGPETTLGVGQCAAGVAICTEGAVEACVGEILPGVEICDGIDNDCDGEIDNVEGLGAACAEGVGGCRKPGGLICGADRLICDATPGEPVAETCNGEDDDCDGLIDEALQAPAADRARGLCAEAVKVCAGLDGWVEPDYRQFAGYEAQGERSCDGIDNDCDGDIDEPGACTPARGLAMWLHTDDQQAGPLAFWPDRVGAPLAMPGEGALEVAIDPATEQPVVHFDGIDDALGLGDVIEAGWLGSDYEIFLALKAAPGPSTPLHGPVGEMTLSLDDGAGASFRPSAIAPAISHGNASDYTDGGFHIVRLSVAGGAGSLSIDGDTAPVSVAEARSTAGGWLFLGGGEAPFVGDIGEIVIYSRALTGAERGEIEAWLSARWQVPMVPGGPHHPAVSGIQTGVDTALVGDRGFSICYQGAMSDAVALADVQAACNGEEIMLACRFAWDDRFILAAEGPRAGVWAEAGPDPDVSLPVNGSGWYLHADGAWGFHRLGSTLNRAPCDDAQDRSWARMCWPLSEGVLSAGGRCGALEGDQPDVVRVILTR